MMAKMRDFKHRRQLESILLICGLVTMSIVILVPMTAPTAQGQVIHDLPNAALEDGIGEPYDVGPVGDNIVIWNATQSHILTSNYQIPPGFTLIIPALNYTTGLPGELSIMIQFPATKIEVLGVPGNPGRLITNSNGIAFDYTAFLGPPFWDGIYFTNNSEGRLVETLINHSMSGVVFQPGSRLMSPGIYGSQFLVSGSQGLTMNGALNYTDIQQTIFDDIGVGSTSLVVSDGYLNISNGVDFLSHGSGLPSVRISDADVFFDIVVFDGYSQAGDIVYIEGESNGTVFSDCVFLRGGFNDPYIRANGSSPLIDNCTFDFTGGQLTLAANENATGVPAHPILRNPAGTEGFFINTTLNVTDGSSITLQWFLDVYVEDPDGNPITASLVTVDSSAPGMPISKLTETAGPDTGWARWFITTELIMYNDSVNNFNPYNVSAENNSAIGYADPQVTMDMTKPALVVVPFSLIPNIPPSVSWLSTPGGIQSMDVTIQYILFDPNPGDNGSLSISIEFSFDNASWVPGTIAAGSPPTSNLDNNTLYSVIWDSFFDLGGVFVDPVYIQITPLDPWGPGTPGQTGPFTLDNEPPFFVTPPTIMVLTNTTATINWTVNENATATVWYGLDDTTTDETSGSTGSPDQSVTLTNLQPGRKYSFNANSTDIIGNSVSSSIDVFYTKVYIQLYTGWNMISIPPDIPDTNLGSVLASIAGQWDIVQTYVTSDPIDPWKVNHTGKPFGNDLDTISFEMGLWIHMLNDAVLIPDQNVPLTGSTFIVPLIPGWNFVGYPRATTTATATALAGVPYDMVQTYDAGSGNWLSFDGATGDLTVMEMGRGYWIHLTSVSLWFINYA